MSICRSICRHLFTYIYVVQTFVGEKLITINIMHFAQEHVGF